MDLLELLKTLRDMRHLAYYATLVLLGGMLVLSTSCTDLSENPYSEVTSKNFNPTGDEIGSLIAPAYTSLRDLWMAYGTNSDLQEESADAWVTPTRPDGWYDGGIFIFMHQHTWDGTHPHVEGVWNTCFRGINSANRVIHQIESDQVSLSADVQESIVAELKALRAYYYFVLLDGWGNVPIVTDFTSEEVPGQNTRQEVYDFVVSELTTNIPKLSESAGPDMYGRMNKWAAKTLLATAYLNAEVYTGNQKYQDVISVTDEIINSGKYSLEDNYLDNFSRDNKNSSENIFSVVYDEINAPGNQWHMKFSKTPMAQSHDFQAAPWGGSSGVPQFINTYSEEDTRLEDSWLTGEIRNNEGEVLMDIQKNIPAVDSSQNYHGAVPVKFELYPGININSDVDFPIFRYAEVLMMKAEALLRTGSAGQAAELVTQVRERAFVDPSDAEVTGAELQQGSTYKYGWWEDGQVTEVEGGDDIQYGRMLDELGWEFTLEGHRRRDLIRFGIFTTKTWFNHRPNGDYRRLFPIPRTALNTNTKLEQNPGY